MNNLPAPEANPIPIPPPKSESEHTKMTSFDLGADGGNSFPFDQIGDAVTGVVLDMEEMQQTDMTTSAPAFWPDGKPKMMYRVTLATQLRDDPEDDGHRTVYLRGSRKADSRSSLAAVLAAVKAAGGKNSLDAGATLTLQYVGDGVQSQRGYNAPKLYNANYIQKPMTLGEDLGEPEQVAQPPYGGGTYQPAPPQQQAPQWQHTPSGQPVQAPQHVPAQLAKQQTPTQPSPADQAARLRALGITEDQIAQLVPGYTQGA